MRSAVTHITGGGEEETEERDRSWSKAGPCRILPYTCSSCGPVPGVSSPRVSRWGLVLQRQEARYNMFYGRKKGRWCQWPEETYHTKAAINNASFRVDWSNVWGKRDLIQSRAGTFAPDWFLQESGVSNIPSPDSIPAPIDIRGPPRSPLSHPCWYSLKTFPRSLRASTPGPAGSWRAFTTADSPDNNLFITTASARRMGFPISGAHFGLPLPGLASGNRGRGGWVWGSGSQIN